MPASQADGQLTEKASVTWKDAQQDAYGPLSSTFATANSSPNLPPVVSAGPNQTIELPTNTVTLNGTVTDDGKPHGATLTIQWTKVSGSGTVAFSSPTTAVTQATFSAADTYVLQLSANDTQYTTTSTVTVRVYPANQPPVVSAGPDQTIPLSSNLIQNAGNESPLVSGQIPNWTQVSGGQWTQAAAGTTGFPAAIEGATYFAASQTAAAELSQDVDVSAFAPTIAAGTQQFEFAGYVHSFGESQPDTSRIVVEYRDAGNTNVLGSFDTGAIASINAWQFVSDTRTAPAGTKFIRIRLIATRNTGADNNGFFDGLSRTIPSSRRPQT